MLKLLIATITLVLGANALASAADLPPQTVAPLTSPVPAYDWTGFYAGGNIGFGTDRYTFLTVSKVRVLNFFRGAGRSFRMDRSGRSNWLQLPDSMESGARHRSRSRGVGRGWQSEDNRPTSQRRSAFMGLFALASDTRSNGSSSWEPWHRSSASDHPKSLCIYRLPVYGPRTGMGAWTPDRYHPRRPSEPDVCIIWYVSARTGSSISACDVSEG